MTSIMRKCAEYGKVFTFHRDKKTGKMIQNLPEPLKPYAGIEPDVAAGAALVAEMMIEPPVSKAKALEWAKERGMLLAELVLNVRGQVQRAAIDGETEALDLEKEGFGATSS